MTLTRMSAPFALWALHFVALYSLQGLACAQQLWRSRIGGLELMTWVLAAVTLAILAAIGWEALRAWRIHRALLGRDDSGRAEQSRRRFMVVLSLLGAAISALGVTFTAAPLALLQTCA
ncbi:hypothetical protein [Luteimonas deserti]|uniref:Uncharacterized protein n=1 Tax=Luteimonas deserti TaxID=2752306 RepID=A0A7Z0QM69_9GAMM|nr:hypothetical protein [Luteimonas deserti]NYZ61212.1 hypothetical protein [Luteimonas deserti]